MACENDVPRGKRASDDLIMLSSVVALELMFQEVKGGPYGD